jgi:hypothetical protein
MLRRMRTVETCFGTTTPGDLLTPNKGGCAYDCYTCAVKKPSQTPRYEFRARTPPQLEYPNQGVIKRQQ